MYTVCRRMLGLQHHCLSCTARPRNDLLCVEWDVKPCTKLKHTAAWRHVSHICCFPWLHSS